MDFLAAAKNLLDVNMGLKSGERLLVLYDETTLKIGESLFAAGTQLGANALAIRMPVLPRNGMEPDPAVVGAMEQADVVVAPLGASITHTQARKKAAAAGARVATMPRITGVILEDEKIYGSVHVALGSNDTFGGTVAAGLHMDGVIMRPLLKLDGRPVVQDGKVLA